VDEENELTVDYPALIKKNNSMYIGWVTELGIFEKNADLTALFETIEKRKQEIIQNLKQSSLDHLLIQKTSPQKKRKDRALSLMKFSILCLFLVFPLQLVLFPLAATLSKVNGMVAKVSTISPISFVNKVGNKFQQLPQEQREEFSQSLSLIGNEFRSVIKHMSEEKLDFESTEEMSDSMM